MVGEMNSLKRENELLKDSVGRVKTETTTLSTNADSLRMQLGNLHEELYAVKKEKMAISDDLDKAKAANQKWIEE